MLQRNIDKELEKFLNEYNDCWLERNIEKLKSFYPEDNNELIFFDNHKNNDTYSVTDHLKLLDDFFQNGKKLSQVKLRK